ncbi:MAG: hypothetical protein Q8O67_13490 [Deltaproteobacteria bacterium]|nr:hypothetical protein [Deltaproteobacteria bacterium]
MTTPPIDFSALGKSIHSQGAEDGMLERIFERLPPRRRFCVEFGAGDGLRNSNTAHLLRDHDWQGVMIEAGDYRFKRLREHHGSNERVRLVQARVQPDNVEAIFRDVGVPDDLDLLSIDIDGNDYWVWQAIERCQPQVVVVEYNPYYEPPERWVMTFNPEHAWDGSTYYGASLESLAALGKRKGYELLACDANGNNAFFVRRESFERFGVVDNAPQVLFRPAMYKVRFVGKNTFLTGHPYRYGPGEAL